MNKLDSFNNDKFKCEKCGQYQNKSEFFCQNCMMIEMDKEIIKDLRILANKIKIT